MGVKRVNMRMPANDVEWQEFNSQFKVLWDELEKAKHYKHLDLEHEYEVSEHSSGLLIEDLTNSEIVAYIEQGYVDDEVAFQVNYPFADVFEFHKIGVHYSKRDFAHQIWFGIRNHEAFNRCKEA